MNDGMNDGKIDGMNDKWVIVTGADRGIGASLATTLADMDYGVVMACYDAEKAANLCEHIRYITSNRRVRPLPLDLSSFSSIGDFVRSIQEKEYNVCALLNNAGTICKKYEQTQEGFEMTMGVNYVGTYLLTRLLLPVLRRSEGVAQVVNTLSSVVRFARVDEHFFTPDPKKHRRFRAYAASKLALMMFTQSLSLRLGAKSGVVVNAFNPGWVNTRMLTLHNWLDPLFNMIVRPLLKTADSVALQQCKALFPKKETKRLHNGWVYTGSRGFAIRDFAASHRHKEWLFHHTEQLLREKGFDLDPV